jgi:hypothetical protein
MTESEKNYFRWSKKILTEIPEYFTTSVFTNDFYRRQCVEFPGMNDRRKTAAEDSLRSLKLMKVVTRIRNGYYHIERLLSKDDLSSLFRSLCRIKTYKGI